MLDKTTIVNIATIVNEKTIVDKITIGDKRKITYILYIYKKNVDQITNVNKITILDTLQTK